MSAPAFIVATDLLPHQADWSRAVAQIESLTEPIAPILGFLPRVRPASLAMQPGEDAGKFSLSNVMDSEAAASEIFVLPASLESSVWQREVFGNTVAEFRRRRPTVAVFHDDADAGHPLLVECFADVVMRELAAGQLPPHRVGLLLAASGQGDSGSRAQSYRFMRLLWEQLSVARADLGFVRHARPFLTAALEHAIHEPLHWVLLPESQWLAEHVEYADTILENFKRTHDEAAGWVFIPPPGDHPLFSAWLTQRMARLWHDRRARDARRMPSLKSQGSDCAPRIWSGAAWDPVSDALPVSGFIAKTRNRDALAAVLQRVLPESDTYLVKVTWHGYATGTYTDAAALDLLLAALPGHAVILEGHTSSRNLGGADWDWETEARQNRAWIKQQDAEFLRRTGLAEVMTRYRAEYLNVTEAYWDGACVQPHGGIALDHPELGEFMPEALLALRGAPLLSFARFKGPTRLAISNLFGFIPTPLRSAWHGANITDFASVCCDIAKLYTSVFPMFGVVEALHSAVQWHRNGLYRSRWGNYDLTLSDGVITVSEGLAGADILASRLQGQDVNRSAFFDVVKKKLEWPNAAVAQPLPVELVTKFS